MPNGFRGVVESEDAGIRFQRFRHLGIGHFQLVDKGFQSFFAKFSVFCSVDQFEIIENLLSVGDAKFFFGGYHASGGHGTPDI